MLVPRRRLSCNESASSCVLPPTRGAPPRRLFAPTPIPRPEPRSLMRLSSRKPLLVLLAVVAVAGAAFAVGLAVAGSGGEAKAAPAVSPAHKPMLRVSVYGDSLSVQAAP